MCVLPASAQSLQRLTVTQLTLSASTTNPRIEVPFDIIITAHVRERVTELQNVDLPVLGDLLELLGDQRETVADANGTAYTERLRVVAHHSGTIIIPPVTLDAIDARNGRPSRFSSNSLTLQVQGPALATTVAENASSFAHAVIRIVQWLAGIAIVVIVLRLIYTRRRVPVAAEPLPPPQPVASPAAQPSAQERLQGARDELRRSPTRTAVVHVRALVRSMVGAGEKETLDDVLRRTSPSEVRMRSLLRSLERAAFTHEADFQPALDDVMQRLEEMT